MPPSFPVGGMENPRLSFITPTIIAGDKSLVSVIAHEMAHSWSEQSGHQCDLARSVAQRGFTDSLQSRIVTAGVRRAARVHGRGAGPAIARADLAETQAQGSRCWPSTCETAIRIWCSATCPMRRPAVPELPSREIRQRTIRCIPAPAISITSVQSITTEQFNDYLAQICSAAFPGIVSSAAGPRLGDRSGIPADAMLPVSTILSQVDEARTAWLSGALLPKKLGLDWTAQQWLYFLDNMPAARRRKAARAWASPRLHAQPERGNRTQLARAGHRRQLSASYARLEEVPWTIGRIKLIKPLYADLMKTPSGSRFAKRVYAGAAGYHHPDTVAAIGAIVAPPDAAGSAEGSER